MRTNDFHRSATAVAACLLVASGLSGCSGTEEGAQSALQAYVDAIATGGAEELAGLAERTVTDHPDGVEAAGTILAGATERIEVLEVGEVHDAEDGAVVNMPPDAGLATNDAAVAATVRYQLAGEEHEGVVVLSPYEGGDRSDPDTWAVVMPLMGTLRLTPAIAALSVPLERYVAGEVVPFIDPNSIYPVPLYPGTYELSRRADPYLTSTSQTVTIVDGEEVEEPSVEVQGTEAVTPIVTESLVAMLDACPNQRCPSEMERLVRPYGVENIWSGDWTLEVTQAPALRLDGRIARFSDGRVHLTLPDGSEVDVAIEGGVSWRVDRSSGEPFATGLTEIVESSS